MLLSGKPSGIRPNPLWLVCGQADVACDSLYHRLGLSDETPPRPSISRFKNAFQLLPCFLQTAFNTRANADWPDPRCREIGNYISQKNANHSISRNHHVE